MKSEVSVKPDQGWIKWGLRLSTPLIDLLSLAAYMALLPALVSLFSNQRVLGFWVVIGGYLLMCAGILVGRRLESPPGTVDAASGSTGKNGCVMALAWPYAAFVLVMAFDASGAFLKGSDWGGRLENLATGSPLFLILSVLVFLIILTLFPFLLIGKPRPVVKTHSACHTLLKLFAVTAVDIMALITAAYWEWQLADSEPMQIALAGKILVFILGYAVFLMFYAPPRLVLMSLEQDRWSFAGYGFLLAVILWNLMA
jgi:hypothetical protein